MPQRSKSYRWSCHCVWSWSTASGSASCRPECVDTRWWRHRRRRPASPTCDASTPATSSVTPRFWSSFHWVAKAAVVAFFCCQESDLPSRQKNETCFAAILFSNARKTLNSFLCLNFENLFFSQKFDWTSWNGNKTDKVKKQPYVRWSSQSCRFNLLLLFLIRSSSQQQHFALLGRLWKNVSRAKNLSPV